MACYDFYSILFFLGAILFIILAAIVDSGYKYQEWKIDNPDDSKKGLYISAGINFGLFILCLIWKYLKEKQIQRQQQLLGQRGFHQIDDSQDHSSPNLMVTRNQESKESELHSNQGVIN